MGRRQQWFGNALGVFQGKTRTAFARDWATIKRFSEVFPETKGTHSIHLPLLKPLPLSFPTDPLGFHLIEGMTVFWEPKHFDFFP